MKLIYIALMILMPTQYLAASPTPSPEMIEQGKKSFAVNCSVCHGVNGQGDGPAAAALNPKPRNFISESFKAGDSAEQVFATVANGLKGTNMQSFGSLSEGERWTLVFYILSLRAK